MAENEKKKEGQAAEPVPPKADAAELPDESLEKVAGGMAAAVPHVDRATLLKHQAEPCCLG